MYGSISMIPASTVGGSVGISTTLRDFFGSGFDIDTVVSKLPIQSKHDYWKLEGNYWQLLVKLPGVTKDDLKVTVKEELVIIEGKEDTEFYNAKYNQSFYLPKNCKRKDLMAVMKDGVLTLTVPKKELDFEVKVD